MSYDLYKKVGVELLAGLNNDGHKVVAITTSNSGIDTNIITKELADAFVSMDLSVTIVQATVDSCDITFNQIPKKINERLCEVSLEQSTEKKLTSLSAKMAIDSLKMQSDITVIALKELSKSVCGMMIAGCCDGILIAERKNSSRTDNIDKVVQTVTNLCVKPLGFILV